MSAGAASDDVLSAEDAAQVASLDAVRELLVADARSWAVQLRECAALSWRASRAGAQTRPRPSPTPPPDQDDGSPLLDDPITPPAEPPAHGWDDRPPF